MLIISLFNFSWKSRRFLADHDPGLAAKKFETPANKSSSEEAAMTREAGFISRRPQNPWNVSQLKKVEVFKIAKEEKHYCPFCEKCFSGVRDLEVHRNTSKHMENVKSDACMQWNHRIPPYASKFELCRELVSILHVLYITIIVLINNKFNKCVSV